MTELDDLIEQAEAELAEALAAVGPARAANDQLSIIEKRARAELQELHDKVPELLIRAAKAGKYPDLRGMILQKAALETLLAALPEVRDTLHRELDHSSGLVSSVAARLRALQDRQRTDAAVVQAPAQGEREEWEPGEGNSGVGMSREDEGAATLAAAD